MMPSEKYFQTAFLRPKQSMPLTVSQSPPPRLLLSSYLNQRAAFEIRPQEGLLLEVAGAFGSASDDPPAKQWQGIITSCEKLSVSKDETVYRFVLEPRFAAMKHFQTSRLFQHQTVPDIVASVFKHHGFSGVDYRFQKSRSYTVREYVTQYLESDFDFINRLCEEEGIWYAFEQHEQHGDVVVFGDSPEHYLQRTLDEIERTGDLTTRDLLRKSWGN